MTQRLYDEKEIATILRAAADESSDSTSTPGVGLSIAELTQIGTESGLDPVAIRRAAARLDADASTMTESTSVWGGPVAYEETYSLDRELTPTEWERVLPAIRRAFGNPGEVSIRPSAFEWGHKNSLDSFTAHVSAVVEGGRTNFHMAASDPPAPVPFFLPTFFVAIMGLPLLSSLTDLGDWAIVVWAMLAALSFVASRTGVKAYARHNRKKVQRLVTDMERILEREAAPAANASEEAIPQPEPPTDLFEGVPDSTTETSTETGRNRSSTT